MDRQQRAAAEAVAADRRNGRLHGREDHRRGVHPRKASGLLERRDLLGHVAAGREGALARAGDDDGADLVVFIQLM